MSEHDSLRDKIVARPSRHFRDCHACDGKMRLPAGGRAVVEHRYAGLLRADVAWLDARGDVDATIEVIDTSAPSDAALEAQKTLPVAWYKLIRSPKGKRYGSPINLCSVDCYEWWVQWGELPRVVEWAAPRCAYCEEYLHANPVSTSSFHDWEDGSQESLCFSCAAEITLSRPDPPQWRAPGDMVFQDPRQGVPEQADDDAVATLIVCAEAAFWSMVWDDRFERSGSPESYDGSRNLAAEARTTVALTTIELALRTRRWSEAHRLLLPIGCPGWSPAQERQGRMLAFRRDNCRRVAHCWRALKLHWRRRLARYVMDRQILGLA